MLPSAKHGKYEKINYNNILSAPVPDAAPTPEQLRWDPLPIPQKPTDLIEGMRTICANGDLRAQAGTAIHLYAANSSMDDALHEP